MPKTSMPPAPAEPAETPALDNAQRYLAATAAVEDARQALAELGSEAEALRTDAGHAENRRAARRAEEARLDADVTSYEKGLADTEARLKLYAGSPMVTAHYAGKLSDYKQALKSARNRAAACRQHHAPKDAADDALLATLGEKLAQQAAPRAELAARLKLAEEEADDAFRIRQAEVVSEAEAQVQATRDAAEAARDAYLTAEADVRDALAHAVKELRQWGRPEAAHQYEPEPELPFGARLAEAATHLITLLDYGRQSRQNAGAAVVAALNPVTLRRIATGSDGSLGIQDPNRADREAQALLRHLEGLRDAWR